MAHIGYFLLLFFFVPTNMICCMEGLMDPPHNIFDLQAQEKTDDIREWNCTNFNAKEDGSMLSPQKIITPEKLIDQKNPLLDDPFTAFLDQYDPSILDPTTDLFGSDNISNESTLFGEKHLTNLSDVSTDRPFNTNMSFNPQQLPVTRNLLISNPPNSQQPPLSTNNGEYFMDLTQDELNIQTQEKTNDLWGQKTHVQSEHVLTQQTLDFDIEEFFNSKNMFDQFKNTEQQIKDHQPPRGNFTIMSQQSAPQNLLKIALQESNKRKLPMLSDDECSVTSDQESDCQETSILEKQPSKKRKVNKKQPKVDIERNLKKSKLVKKFLVDCPEPKCQERLHSLRTFNLKRAVLRHISNEHSENRDRYSTESIATYVNKNVKKNFFPA